MRKDADNHALIQRMVNSVSVDNIVNNVRGLQSFGSRYEYNSAQDSAAAWIMRQYGWEGIPAASQEYSIGLSTFRDIAVIDVNTACIAAGSAILRTSDGGKTWTSQSILGSFNSPTYIYSVDFPTPQIGWLVGTSGFIAKSVDGGLNWTTQVLASSYSFYDVKFVDKNHGLIAGADGVILRTSDGGVSWSPVNSGTQNALYQIDVLEAANVWAAGSNGTMLHSLNGGETWSTQNTGVSYALDGVDFINPRLGWAVGSGHQFLRTNDGGTTWTLVSPGVEAKDIAASYTGIYFADSLRGWITDNTGGVLRTNDAGNHWQKTNPLNRYGWCTLWPITMLKDNRLISCGQGRIVISSDGGITWTNSASSLPAWMFHQSENIVVTIPGTITPEKECVLVAHYDCAWEGTGADDNASGTSAVMEAARILKYYKFESTITLLAVSAEEIGLKGSEEYVARAKNNGRNIIGVLNADMIGFPIRNDTSRLVVLSYVSPNHLADSVMSYNNRYGIGLIMGSYLDSTGASDYSPFAMAGYDAVQLIEGSVQDIWGGLNPYYHTAHDSLSKLHPGLMRRGAQLMVATAAELAKPAAPLTSVEGSTPPSSFVLEQNFPNPFNGQTILTFRIPRAVFATLKVFDVLGREVTSVFSGELEPGVYSFCWNANNVSSGLYVYQLQAGSFISSRKMILLK